MYKIKRFSKISDKDLDKKKRNALGAGIFGGLIGNQVIDIANNSLISDVKKKTSELSETKESKELTKKLLDKAKKQGIKVVEDPNFNNSAYLGTGFGGSIRKGLSKLKKVGRKKGDKSYIDAAEVIENSYKSALGDKGFQNLGKDSVLMGKINDASILSHELGHAGYSKGRGGLLGRSSHNLYGSSAMLGGLGSSVYGYNKGKKNARKIANGEKLSTWDKVGSAAIPLALSAPLLAAEGSASIKGLKMLKESGASKEFMNSSKKNLGKAWGTYGLKMGAGNVLSGVASEQKEV